MLQHLQGEFSRDVGAHIGETSGDKASMKAEIPVSDIVEFVQKFVKGANDGESDASAKGVAAGDSAEDAEEEHESDDEDALAEDDEFDDSVSFEEFAAKLGFRSFEELAVVPQTLPYAPAVGDTDVTHKLLSTLNVFTSIHNSVDLQVAASHAGFAVIFYDENLATAGYKGFAFVKDNIVIISHRATDLDFCDTHNSVYSASECKKAWDTDMMGNLDIALGNVPAQYYEAEKFYHQIKTLYPGYKIVHTGHSRSGVLAPLLGLQNAEYSISFDSPGVYEIATKLMSKEQIAANKKYMTVINSNPNFINSHGTHVAHEIYHVKVPLKKWEFSAKGLRDYLDQQHSMKSIDTYLDNKVKVTNWGPIFDIPDSNRE